MAIERNNAGSLLRALQVALGLALAFALQGLSHASILRMDVSTQADDVLASVFDDSSTSSAESPQTQSPVHPNRNPSDPSEEGRGYVHDLEAPGTTGTSSSSSPSPGSFGGTAPFLMCEILSLDESSFVVRLALSQSLLLPTPPGVDLLRPPRA